MIEELLTSVVLMIEANLLKNAASVFVLMAAEIAIVLLRPLVKKIDKSVDSIDFSDSTHRLIENAIRYMTYAVAIVIIFYIFGVTDVLYAFLTGGAILGFAIGYASKDVISNMLAGILIALDRPFKIGDKVKISGIEGDVIDIKLRTTEIKTPESVMVLIPNSKVLSGAIYNYTDGKPRK